MSDTFIENEPGTFNQAITPMLARVLAQAASTAYVPADVETFYVVSRYEFARDTTEPFNVKAPFSTYAAAEAEANRLMGSEPGVAYGVFGPFRNTSGGFAPEPNQETVAEIQVTPQLGGVRRPSFPIDGTRFDALFFSIQAVEKFLLPYYAELISPSFADHMLNTFQSGELAMMAHLPWSEYVDIAPTGTGTTRQNVVMDGPGDHAGETPPTGGTAWIPVVFHRDPDGTVRPQPIFPPRPGQA
jgi:hypothetical protein